MATLDYGVIAELINIPEDNTGRRFLTSLLVSLGINVAAMVGVSVASQLHEPNDRPATTVVAKAQEWSFESPKLTLPEAKPIVAPLPKHRPAKIKRTIKKTEFKKKQVVPDSQREAPQPTPAPELETPEEQPLELPTKTTFTKTAPPVAASAERVGSVASLAVGGNNPSSASDYRPTEISHRVGVSGASGAVVRGGNSGFSPSASGTNFMATISLASPVRGRGPAIRSATLLPASQATMISAVSDEGRTSPALSAGSDPGARGTVATSVGVSGGTGVRGVLAGKAGVAGSRAIGIGLVAVGEVSVSGAGASTGTSRGPATGPGRLTESTVRVGGASEAEHGSGISAGGGNTVGAMGGSVARTGGGGGPQGQAGRAGSGGSGGSAAQASEGGTARVDTKQTSNTAPVVNQRATVASSSNAPTKRNEDAERTSDPDPELTSDMKKEPLNVNLRVRVTVDTDGSHSEELVQGSGNREVDQLILKTMRRWKWRPALRDGEKAQQTLTFRYKININ
ncbi:TonB family protein [Armatimonas sp.]|uniref:energy transducer TonB n=1 Tax=Armatimonas sp. TaxID=1872638 RepID=UPI0037539286